MRNIRTPSPWYNVLALNGAFDWAEPKRQLPCAVLRSRDVYNVGARTTLQIK